MSPLRQYGSWPTSDRTQLTGLRRILTRDNAKDPYTHSHCETVSTIAALIAQEIGFDARRLAQVRVAGLLHDVGKIGIPNAILNKPGSLDAREWEVMRSHSRLGHEILAAAGLHEEARWVLHHHERLDGNGYPDRLAGEEIPLESRILMVADTFEAITSNRSYRPAASEASAIDELRRHVGTQFDARCVAALQAIVFRNQQGGHPMPTVSAPPDPLDSRRRTAARAV